MVTAGIYRRVRVECIGDGCTWFGYRPWFFQVGERGFDNRAAGTIAISGEPLGSCPRCKRQAVVTKVAGKWHKPVKG